MLNNVRNYSLQHIGRVDMNEKEQLEQLTASVTAIRETLARRIVGQHEVIADLLACFLSGGHCLLIGVPAAALANLLVVRGLQRYRESDFFKGTTAD